MAPALTEPLSPTENLTSSAVTSATTPTTRSSRQLDCSVGNSSETISIKSAFTNREKRNRNAGITNQTPTTSKRLARLRDSLQSKSLSPTTSDNIESNSEAEEITSTKRISKETNVKEIDSSESISIKNNTPDTKNEQMGLSTAPVNNQKKIYNNNNTNTSQNLDTIDDKTKDTSTAQLLADLTNEALTAEICLRNQLKDVNLVKTPSSPIIPQDSFVDTDSDIVGLKSDSPTIAIAADISKKTTAHMEAQFNKAESSSFLDTTSNEEEGAVKSAQTTVKDFISPKKEEVQEKEIVAKDKCGQDDNEHKNENSIEGAAAENYSDNALADSPQSTEDTTEAKKTASKTENLPLQELPPVSTDSTMTASEVEDNLEERLSQLDGTAIDSPPPNNHGIDSNDKSSQNSETDTNAPSHQQNLSNDIPDLQQQLQQTPPTPVAEEVEPDQLEVQHEEPQQTNCFTTPQSTQSTTSSINLLSNASNNASHSYTKETDNVGGGAAELEDQDIEEVFKVLKGFEGGTTSDLNVCDLNVLFNEVYMKINETELSGHTVSGGSITANNQSHANVANPSIQLVKPTEMEEVQTEIGKRQLQMHRKIDFLLRRLRKLQARYMCKHTSEEIAGLFEWSARQASKGVTNTSCLQHTDAFPTGAQDPNKCFLKVISARPPASDWRGVNETLVPANQISALMRKIESVANAQQLCTTPATSSINVTNKKIKKAMDAQTGLTANNISAMGGSTFNEGKAEEVVVATLEENITDELSQVAGLLQIEMSEVQKAIDSDATESSSGGESADEMVTYNNTQQQTLPITKRAAWRYSRDRAAIASRWSWLLSQIADLEIKIRQHSDLHQEVVRSKGPVTSEMESKNTEEELPGSCRTRGFMPSLFRKRKLIQTTNIHTISKKAARPSTIKCGCQWPLHPCALCTGRLDPTAPRDLPDTMMLPDRIALLDSGYHPVLSFRENVNNALHFEAIAKQPEWQQRVMRCQAKNIAKNVWRAEREAVAAAAGGHHSSSSKKYSEPPPTKRRYIKKKDRLNNEEKTSGKSSNTTTGTQQHNAVTIATATAPFNSSLTSLNDVGNGTASLSTTSSTTPLVANKGTVKGAKKQQCPVVKEEILKESSNSLLPPKCLSTTSFTSIAPSLGGTTTTTSHKKYIHQTSDCLPTNYDQSNPNQTPSSLISNNHNHNSSSKSNKHRKLSSSTVVNSHHYNHSNNINNNLYNGDSSYMLSQEYWGGTSENFNVRSRTSSPTHGSSGNLYHKYERSFDRKIRTSYDIDNIVIPYSVAAATRVEVLPYKEIPTPKWRLIDVENDQIESSNANDINLQESDIEALLEATTITNGYVCKSKNNNLLDYEKQSKKGPEEDKSRSSNSKESFKSDVNVETRGNDNCLLAQATSANILKNNKIKKSPSHNQETNSDCNDEVAKEPEVKKLKIDMHLSDSVKSKSQYNEAEKECNEMEISMQNVSKISIEEDEDISDDAMFLRHERALTEERRKFQTYLKFPWSTRSRANRRIDSRAESSGANTPDPSSPAPQTPSVGGGDLESIPSPLNPATPLNPLDTNSEAGDNSTSFLGINSLPSLSSKRYERRRTTSTKRDRELERRSSTPDSKELIPPYEPLTFPLTDEQFEELLRAMPSDHGEDCKRFDDCYLPGGSGGNSSATGLGGVSSIKYPRTLSSSTSKRSSRASTLCGDTITTTTGGGRRTQSFNSKNKRPISADDCNADDVLLFDDDYEDDYPKHHLAPNDDDHPTADSVGVNNFNDFDSLYNDDDEDVYGDQYGAYVGRRKRKTQRDDIEEDSSEEEPFQDDDPNDPEWCGETEERFRKKV